MKRSLILLCFWLPAAWSLALGAPLSGAAEPDGLAALRDAPVLTVETVGTGNTKITVTYTPQAGIASKASESKSDVPQNGMGVFIQDYQGATKSWVTAGDFRSAVSPGLCGQPAKAFQGDRLCLMKASGRPRLQVLLCCP